LAAQLRRDESWLGTVGMFPNGCFDRINDIGKVIKTLFAGDQDISDATSCLRKSVDNYRQAMDGMSIVIGVEVFKMVKGIKPHS
jgi:hypothetical protein